MTKSITGPGVRFSRAVGVSLLIGGCFMAVSALAADPPAKRKSPFPDYNLSRPAPLDEVSTKDDSNIGMSFAGKSNWREDVVARINDAIRQQVKVDGDKLKYDEAVVVDLEGYYTKGQILQIQKELKSAGWNVWRVKGSNFKGGIDTIYLTAIEKD